MSEINLKQSEADALISLEKHRVGDTPYDFPTDGGSLLIPLQSFDKREQFLLDISRGKIDLLKGKYQNRARQVIVLVRLDFGGSPHRNPDGEEVNSPHIHLYREGYGDKWAYPVTKDKISNTSDLWQTLGDFMRLCNITQTPFIERGLFI